MTELVCRFILPTQNSEEAFLKNHASHNSPGRRTCQKHGLHASRDCKLHNSYIVYSILLISGGKKIAGDAREKIEKIKNAEEEAVLLVESARKDAVRIQEEAKIQADHYRRQAHRAAVSEIEEYRAERMVLAEKSVSEIASRSTESARRMDFEYTRRMSGAASYIAGKVTGKDHVLSSRDE